MIIAQMISLPNISTLDAVDIIVFFYVNISARRQLQKKLCQNIQKPNMDCKLFLTSRTSYETNRLAAIPETIKIIGGIKYKSNLILLMVFWKLNCFISKGDCYQHYHVNDTLSCPFAQQTFDVVYHSA